MAKAQRYVYVAGMKSPDDLAGPDFIGGFAKETDNEIVLVNPLGLEYYDFKPMYSPNFMPLGVEPTYSTEFTLSVPKRFAIYWVIMDDKQRMVREYLAALMERKRLEQAEAGEGA